MPLISNLSDAYPWGLWISFDLLCGVALAAGAFTMAAIVHIFRLEKYHSLCRPAILTGFLGYLMVILPEDALAGILGKSAWRSMPAGVILGVPMYSNAADIIPVVHALMEKGAALGTVLQILEDALKFHGHKCWASTAGVRIGLAALDALGAERSGAKSLHAVLEIGDYHGTMCFGDGVQYTTGCTFGKGNIEKNPKGKLAVTLIDKANNKAVHVSYKPTLQKQIKGSPYPISPFLQEQHEYLSSSLC